MWPLARMERQGMRGGEAQPWTHLEHARQLRVQGCLVVGRRIVFLFGLPHLNRTLVPGSRNALPARCSTSPTPHFGSPPHYILCRLRVPNQGARTPGQYLANRISSRGANHRQWLETG